MLIRTGSRLLYANLARVAQAAAHANRIELLELLSREHSVEELSRATGMSMSNTSSHLQILSRANLVWRRKEGTTVFYQLANDEVRELLALLRKLQRAAVA